MPAQRRGIAAEVLPGCGAGHLAASGARQPVSGKVSIIIPTCAAQGYIETCVKSLRERTAYRNFEIICVDNIPDNQIAWKVWLQQNADKFVPMPDALQLVAASTISALQLADRRVPAVPE